MLMTSKADLRLTVLSYIATTSSEYGKTAVMKFMFFLQHCFGLKLGYKFGIYTYGPFSQDVMADIDFAQYNGFIKVIYERQHNRYRLEPTEKSSEVLSLQNIQNLKPKIDAMLAHFGRKSVKDLELFSTIAYVHISSTQNQQNLGDLPSTVHSMKPHFSVDTIINAYDELQKMGVLVLDT